MLSRTIRPLLLAALLASVSEAALAQGQTIREIRVDGTQRIEATTVLSYLTVRPGDTIDRDQLDQSLKTLFGTGLFADVGLEVKGDTLIVKVVENPIINRIALEGNKKVESDKLEQELQLRPRTVYTRTRVQADVDRLLEIYRRSGRYSARIEPKVIQLDGNRVDIVFEIEEGPRTPVRRINFVGNTHFSDADLRDVIQTKEAVWWRFLTSNDSYDPDRVQFDKELLRRYYLREGYADFRVVGSNAELTPDKQNFFLTFTVDEGERYKFNKVEIHSDLKGLDVDKLKDDLTFEPGDWYNATAIEDAVVALTNAVGNQQYPFVEVRPEITRNKEAHTIDVVFNIGEGPRVFVERINITGNVRTVDEVIRREFQLAEGDPFNQAKLKRSEQRVKDLGFFEKVDVINNPGSEPDRTIIDVNVTEQSTGEIQIGAGFSSTDGPLIDFRIRERNLLGEGKDLQFATTVSRLTKEFSLGYTQPYFLRRDLAAGFDLFHVRRDFQDFSNYNQVQTGFDFKLGYPIAERLRQRFIYRLERNDITDISLSASPYILDQAGKRVTSLIGQELSWDMRDSRIDPTKGFVVTLSTDLAGIGGDVHFGRAVLSGGWYRQVFDSNVVFSVTGEIGGIFGLGEDVRIANRFFIGGDTLRGFKVAGIGPRDIDTRDALGGNYYAKTTAEFTFPLGLPQEFGIKAHAFTDIGTLWGMDGKGKPVPNGSGGTIVPRVFDTAAPRVAPGVGVSWKSPLGPLRIDIAIPVVKQKYDETEVFRFSFGTKF
jgi:outer membrane protein insertion porin family